MITSQLSVFRKIWQKCSLKLPFSTLPTGYLSYYLSEKEKIVGAVFLLAPQNSSSNININITQTKPDFQRSGMQKLPSENPWLFETQKLYT